MTLPTARLLAVCFGAALLLSLAACADANRSHPVSGLVLFRGKPAEGAIITFVPRTDDNVKNFRPSAIVRPDGSFRLSTRGTFDGAPAGAYAVTIIYPSPEAKVDDQNAGPDLLQGKYRDAGTTPLRAEIKPGDNDLEPFVLR